MRVRADRPHGYGCRGSCPCRPCQAGAAPSSRAVGAFSLRVVGEMDSATSPSSAPFSLSRVDAIRRARQWSQDLRLTSRYYVGRSRRDLESDWVRFRSRRLWKAERHGACLSPGSQAENFFSSSRASACWYFCWYRQESKKKITSNPGGYGIMRLPARHQVGCSSPF